jgi:ABC-type multidrug transport system ATPase subunit
MDALGLAGKASTKFGKLSGGQQQRLSIALALVGNPRVAMLDELTTGLDPQARRDTWDLIEGVRDRGVTIVLVTHFMEEAERLCDRVALIDAGRVVAIDTPAALAERVQTEQRIQFRPSVPLDDGLLAELPDVTSIIRRGDVVVVTGNNNALNAVTSVLLRTAQEGLANVARHARATRAWVTLSYMEHEVALDVRDDGRGFDPAQAGGFGLIAMRQRVEGSSGTLQVESEPGAGTAISACLPLGGQG